MADKKLQTRALEEADWPTVRAIYLEGIATGQATFETAAPSWEAWDATHFPAPRLVAVSAESVVGWAALGRQEHARHSGNLAGVTRYRNQWLGPPAPSRKKG